MLNLLLAGDQAATSSRTPSSTEQISNCSLCAEKGQIVKLKLCQINHEEAIFICPTQECIFPLGSGFAGRYVIKRKADDALLEAYPRKIKKQRLGCDEKADATKAPQINGFANLSTGPSISNSSKLIAMSPRNDVAVNGFRQSSINPNVDDNVHDGGDPNLNPQFHDIVNVSNSNNLMEPVNTQNSEVALNVSMNTGGIKTSNPSSTTQIIPPNSKDKIVPAKNRTRHLIFSKNSVSSPEIQRVDDSRPMPSSSSQSKFKDEDVKQKTVDKNECLVSNLISLKFIHWRNEDALCWLHVVFSLLTHSRLLRRNVAATAEKDSIFTRLISAFDTAQNLFQQSLKLRRCELLCRTGKTVKLETSIGQVMVKTGGGDASDVVFYGQKSIATIVMDASELPLLGNSCPSFDMTSILSKDDPDKVCIDKMSQEAKRLDESSRETLSKVRDALLSCLKPKVGCVRGKNDSPLIALMTMLRLERPVRELVGVEYDWKLVCSSCSHVRSDSTVNEVPTFLRVPHNFSITSPSFYRDCYECQDPNQIIQVNFKRLPELFFVHFFNGILNEDIEDLDFEDGGLKYAVTGVIQYKNNPDHFVCWLREPVANLWMECDDIKALQICRYTKVPLQIPASEVHIVMWELQAEDSGYVKRSRKVPNVPAELPIGNSQLVTAPIPLLVPQSTAVQQSTAVPQSANVSQSVTVPLSAEVSQSSAMPPPVLTPQIASSDSMNQLASVTNTFAKNAVPNSLSNKGTAVVTKLEEGVKHPVDRLQRMREKFAMAKNGTMINSTRIMPPLPSVALPYRLNTTQPSEMVKSETSDCPVVVGRRRQSTAIERKAFLDINLSQKSQLATQAPVRHSSLVTVSRNSHMTLDEVLGNRKNDHTAFERYIPKSQKKCEEQAPVSNTSSAVCPSSQPLEANPRKPRVCFSMDNSDSTSTRPATSINKSEIPKTQRLQATRGIRTNAVTSSKTNAQSNPVAIPPTGAEQNTEMDSFADILQGFLLDYSNSISVSPLKQNTSIGNTTTVSPLKLSPSSDLLLSNSSSFSDLATDLNQIPVDVLAFDDSDWAWLDQMDLQSPCD